MKKRILELLCVVATFALAGCGAEAPEPPEPLAEVSLPVEAPIPRTCESSVPGFLNYWISPDGIDALDRGTFEKPMATLKGLHDSVLVAPLTSDIVVHVDDGTYAGERMNWTKFGTDKRIIIEACPHAMPVFDGLIDGVTQDRFLALDPSGGTATRVTLKGLTFRNFFNVGIIMNKDGGCSKATSTSNNTIDGCTFENIGNLHATCKDGQLVVPCTPGHGAIQMENSRANRIANNTFVRIENKEADRTLVHAIYAADCSSDNVIEGNSVDRCSGAPITFRNKSNCNIVANNYFNRAGAKSIVGAWFASGESSSLGNQVYGNVATFPHEFDPGPLVPCEKGPGEICTAAEVDFTPENEAATPACPAFALPEGAQPNLFELEQPVSEAVVAVLGGDFDHPHDGVDEVVAAFNYDGNYSGFTKVVSTAGSIGNRHFHRVLYANGGEGEDFFWDVAKLVAGDFDDDGDVELLTAFHADTATYVYKGDGVSHLDGCTEPGSIYSDTSSPYFRVTGMAAGNFDSDGADEVVTAFEKSDNTTIDSGDGISSLTNGPAYFTNDTAPYWHVTAMSAGNFNTIGRDEVITAMNKQGSSPAYKIYSTNDTTSIDSRTLHSSVASPFWITTATVGGAFNLNGPDAPITGMYSAANYKLYRGDGTSGVMGTTLATSTSPMYIRALGSGYFDAGTNLDLVTAIEQPGRTGDDLRIYVGNGWSDYDDFWELYSSYHND